MTGLSLVNKLFRRCLRLCANPLRTLETCHSTLLSHVGNARPDRYFKHRHSKHYADGAKVTGYKT
jgi:hypothetical protein